MNLVKFENPHYRVTRDLVDDLFDGLLMNDTHACDCSHRVATNISETEKDFRIELMLPGFTKNEVSMNYHKNLLSVKAAKEQNKKNQDESHYLQREFRASDVEKQFNIPESVDAEKINAKFKNGILEVILPKKEEALEKSPLAISIS
jgi:HSP20 family protein